jgi:hypothetical protein
MSPRVIQMPLSGGDRKHFARELRRVESLHAALVKKIEAVHRAAEDHLRVAHRLECEEWNARLFLGGDESPSPAIDDAIDAGATILEVKCNACRGTRQVDLSHVIWPRKYQVHTLRSKLFCEPCKATTGRKVRPMLVGLFDPNPEPEATVKAARR